MTEPLIVFPNADKMDDFIDSEPDPVVRSLMRLVYGEFLNAIFSGKRPEGSVDMVYCFSVLRTAFHRSDALANALDGKYGDPSPDLDWT